MNAPRYGIAEWYGYSFLNLSPSSRSRLAGIALSNRPDKRPCCPFQEGTPPCSKKGGICSLNSYAPGEGGMIACPPQGSPVIVCPKRFNENHVIVRWLADIVDFPQDDVMLAKEVPFMQGTETGRPAGKIDLVIARGSNERWAWYGLEIQAVYFSGPGMQSEFSELARSMQPTPPFPSETRRPDWRSSSAKRLMPQLQIKVPTLRRWGSKMAVAVDRPFFEAIGGPSSNPSHDLGDGDIIWLVPEMAQRDNGTYRLTRGHWEVLTLEDSRKKLLAAHTVRRDDFETTLRNKLEPLR